MASDTDVTSYSVVVALVAFSLFSRCCRLGCPAVLATVHTSTLMCITNLTTLPCCIHQSWKSVDCQLAVYTSHGDLWTVSLLYTAMQDLLVHADQMASDTDVS